MSSKKALTLNIETKMAPVIFSIQINLRGNQCDKHRLHVTRIGRFLSLKNEKKKNCPNFFYKNIIQVLIKF